MADILRPFFDSRSLNPHGICLLWRPELIWTHVVSDAVIGAAYFSIPLALGTFLYHRRDVRFGWAIRMFVAFIMLCGLTHFMSIWTLWNADYGLEALIKAATAVASLLTAVALWPLLPKILAIPSTAMLESRIKERDEALERLEAAMATMVEMEEHQREQQRLVEELARKEALLRTFADAVPGVVYAKDRDGRMLVANRGAAELIGKPPEAFLGRTDAEFLENKADAAAVMAADREVMDTGQAVQLEEHVQLADSSPAIWLSSKAPMRDPSGAIVGLVGSSIDITARKRAESARELLMREVDHRARNALSVVQSIIRLTPAQEPDRFKAVVAGRVASLARAQTSLSKSSWEGARVVDIVCEEMGVLTSPERYEVVGADVLADAEQVQPLSMVVHELATNALKHGALSRPDGSVQINVVQTSEDWRLTWSESTGQSVTEPTRSGFGSRLIKALAQQLGGPASFDWQPTGLVFSIAVRPVSSARRA